MDEILIDDEQDALSSKVNMGENGARCHVGYKAWLYRQMDLDDTSKKANSEKIDSC